jgi:hypothetical protein
VLVMAISARIPSSLSADRAEWSTAGGAIGPARWSGFGSTWSDQSVVLREPERVQPHPSSSIPPAFSARDPSQRPTRSPVFTVRFTARGLRFRRFARRPAICILVTPLGFAGGPIRGPPSTSESVRGHAPRFGSEIPPGWPVARWSVPRTRPDHDGIDFQFQEA